ncbi:MAG: metal ABC transporter permease [Candidatus Pacebacteria bacterium]|nr:metal ABC transporter permease [Candidatus Paceibacterota bacterium]
MDQITNLAILKIISVLFVAALSGIVGVFALTRRMTLAADAMSHIALPGLGLAIMFKIDPLIGGGLALVLGALLVWALERKTKISAETVIGVIFSASLALGSLLIHSGEELLDALFGNIGSLTFNESIFGIVASIIIIALILKLKSKFTLSFISEDIARVSGINTSLINLTFLLCFVVAIILGLKFLGALLMGSLVIIPAASSRNLAKGLNFDLLISVLIAIISVISGLIISSKLNLDLGPIIVVSAAFIFFISVILKKED